MQCCENGCLQGEGRSCCKHGYPLYKYLKEQKGFGGFDPNHPLTPLLESGLYRTQPDFRNTPDIKWNFTKFLIDRDGNVVERFEPTTF